MKHRFLPLFALLLLGAAGAQAQSPFGNSDPSPQLQCGEYQWPEVQSPCPEVQIKQKHDHTPLIQYREAGWDTAVTCRDHEIVLSCMPYIPVQYFNGGYYVDTIPYDPPDTSFHFGSQLPNDEDDKFCALQTLPSDFPFFFFGIEKNSFVASGNGMITFNTSSANQNSSFGNHLALPWSGSNYGANAYDNVGYHRDAIYGIFQDTDPSCNVSGYQGIWYGVMDTFPCRKIIASYNDLPFYSCSSNANNRQKYQIVCYEGSNIIEVHVARRNNATCSWCSNGILGIQNATGQPQVRGTGNVPNRQVIAGSPAAYWVDGMNPLTTQYLDHKAYRFTPRGSTSMVSEWYLRLPDGDSIMLGATDEGYGFVTAMDENSSCPTLTTATVHPDTVSRYIFHLKFKNANGTWYDLYDSIEIGIDTTNDLYLRNNDDNGPSLYICAATEGNLTLEYPSQQRHDTIVYRTTRISGGDSIDLDPNAVLSIGQWTNGISSKRLPITVNATLPSDGQQPNKIDTLLVQATVEFVSGCRNYVSMPVYIYPNFDLTDTVGICHGESLTWNGQIYTETATDTRHLQSTPGCDSVVHLDLTVYEVSHNIDAVKDCQPYTWINGITYTASNGSTALTDTILLQNEWGCDSIVQLDFQLLPVTAQIKASREAFDFDHLDVELNDISLNNDARTWLLPGVANSTSPTAYYTIPSDLDEADIWLIATSPYGCIDSTHIVIPMRKENFWVPNTFMPDNASGNNLFHSISLKTMEQEMFIYNRHGILVFSCEGADCPWNGRDYNGNPCPSGTYVYVIRYVNEFFPKRTQVVRGTVTLIR